MATDTVRNVVLVHGGFVDGSGWQGVYESLTRDGFRVSVVQNPTLSLDGDAAATRWVLDAQDGPAVLVGHSYGGAIITEAGTHPNVAALVYVCAFAPDKDESVGSLIAGFPADGPQPPILPPRDGFLFLDRDNFHAWYLVTSEDRMIPPPAQHTMASRIGATVTEVAASHSVYVSQPEAVATVIAQAAAGQ
jgi:pimeloyl-ACP methyl ester carboxylesterase